MAKDGDLRKQFGAFMRSAVKGLDQVREVVVAKSKAGKIQIDVAMLRRKRKDVLAELGAAVASLAAQGKLREDEFPELSAPFSALESVDQRIAEEEDRARRMGDPVSRAQDERDEEEEEAVRAAKDGLDSDREGG